MRRTCTMFLDSKTLDHTERDGDEQAAVVHGCQDQWTRGVG